jgi:predicted RNA binding protein YcfA (HicA-like mRNA interferase family)
LEKAGFFLARQGGSHMIYKNASGRRVTVPFHAQKILLLRDADIKAERLIELL